MMDQPPRTQQEVFQEQLQVKVQQAATLAKTGGHAAHRIALVTWQESNSIAEKMVLIAGLLGIVSFFLPWYSVSAFVFSASGSGFAFARHGRAILWFFPLMMIAALFLSWFHLHSNAAKRVLTARWLIFIGAAWTWDWVSVIWSSDATVGFGGYLAAIASLLVLISGLMQTNDRIRALPTSGGAA